MFEIITHSRIKGIEMEISNDIYIYHDDVAIDAGVLTPKTELESVQYRVTFC